MDTPWGQQLSVLWIIVAMFAFVVHSVIVALLAWWMRKDGIGRKIESINWWMGGYLLVSFVPLPGPWFNWIVLVLYAIFRANYAPGEGKKTGVAGKAPDGPLGEDRKRVGTVIVVTSNVDDRGHLKVIASPGMHPGDILPLQMGKTKLGASYNCHVIFSTDSTMSAEHAAISKVEEPNRVGWELMDIGGRNGTFVWNQALKSGQGDWERIEKPVLLKSGARFKLGPATTLELYSSIG